VCTRGKETKTVSINRYIRYVEISPRLIKELKIKLILYNISKIIHAFLICILYEEFYRAGIINKKTQFKVIISVWTKNFIPIKRLPC
jgi:phosphoenolpyruvate synthase/pyruvate phosphate dikinase